MIKNIHDKKWHNISNYLEIVTLKKEYVPHLYALRFEYWRALITFIFQMFKVAKMFRNFVCLRGDAYDMCPSLRVYA